jgi:UDP-N-acetylglucosamine 2-epimerase (non-hydrolysing)
MKITIVGGARPNFMKIAPIVHCLQQTQKTNTNLSFRLIHTGQHYDNELSGTFFEELDIPEPDANLGVGSGTQAEQTANIMIAFEKELLNNPVDLVIVVGDVNSTLACSIVAKKLNTMVAHVEGGIRSYDLSMPEEINRMVTDSISDYFFTTSTTASENLLKLGIDSSRIYFVGNTMIDTLRANEHRLFAPGIFTDLKLTDRNYFVLTLHRPANVDDKDILKAFLKEITRNVSDLPVIFPIHPRTLKIYQDLGIESTNLHITSPMGYLEFNFLVKHAKAVITDSGGITEESTVMGVPCLTLRNNTERPETCIIGTNELVGTDPHNLKPYLNKLFSGGWKKGNIPELWDGHAAERIVECMLKINL